MNWLDRYVAAVRRYLPARQRADVGEEIRSTLQEQMDEAIAREQYELAAKLRDEIAKMTKSLSGNSEKP